ncbi:putative biofilm formation methyltransferase WspC [compost metagenome]
MLAQIARLANAGSSAEAQAACARYLQHYPPHAQVFYWLGLLSDIAGDTGEALSHYRKALYLDPQHAEALAHLAALLASQGDIAGARRLQERAARRADRESEQ